MLVVGTLLVLVGAIGLVITSRTPRLVRNDGRPLAEPRTLTYLDAWQTVIFDAGRDAERIRSRVLASCIAPDQQRFTCAVERIWHWGLDGATEREQIVLRHGRGIVFCQVYGYGVDLYVGWDAHLNTGTWRERQVRKGRDAATGARVTLMAVEPATQPIGEYDLADLNCLLEWTHAQLTRVLKQYLKEREIDQEIDFTIIRGNRQDATRPPTKRHELGRALFRRTA